VFAYTSTLIGQEAAGNNGGLSPVGDPADYVMGPAVGHAELRAPQRAQLAGRRENQHLRAAPSLRFRRGQAHGYFEL